MIDVRSETLIGVSEAAKMLAMCRATVMGYVTRGELDAVRAGRTWRTSVEAVERFLQPPEQPLHLPTPRQRNTAAEKEHEQAMKELRARGLM